MAEEIELQDIDDAFELLCEAMGMKEINDVEGVRILYKKLLSFLAFASNLKGQILLEIDKEEPDSVAEFVKRVREGVLKGFHYEERKQLNFLGKSKDYQEKKKLLERLNFMIESTKRFENILRMIFETMKTDLKLGFEGHE